MNIQPNIDSSETTREALVFQFSEYQKRIIFEDYFFQFWIYQITIVPEYFKYSQILIKNVITLYNENIKNIIQYPIAIRIPPKMIDFLYPKYRSANNPPRNGVRNTNAINVPYRSDASASVMPNPSLTSLRYKVKIPIMR